MEEGADDEGVAGGGRVGGGIGSPYFLVPLGASGHNPEKFMNFLRGNT